jgi:CheY-like chemotaxis protein
VRVVIGEDEPLLREGLALLLSRNDFDVVSAVGDADALRAAAATHRPDVVVTDIRMPPTRPRLSWCCHSTCRAATSRRCWTTAPALFRLAGQHPPDRGTTSEHISPGLLRVLDRLAGTPAEIVTELGETLRQSPLSVALIGEATGYTGPARSRGYRWFTDPATRQLYTPTTIPSSPGCTPRDCAVSSPSAVRAPGRRTSPTSSSPAATSSAACGTSTRSAFALTSSSASSTPSSGCWS